MSETLDQALSRVWEQDWKHRRSGPTLKSQATKALLSIFRAINGPDYDTASLLTIGKYTCAEDIGDRDVQQATAAWYAEGLAPATIQKRLNCLSKLGVNVEGCRKPQPKQLKWHLPEDKRSEVILWCDANDYKELADLIKWTTRTGLRIEESLRLTASSFHRDYGASGDGVLKVLAVNVPGTKTGNSQATLPLGSEASLVPWGWLLALPTDKETMFSWTYEQYQQQWNHVREHFGWKDDPTATLKALRRSAARYLHVDCGMPLHMVQQYLRHESMDTTLEYLRLTGGYGTEEMRRYLR